LLPQDEAVPHFPVESHVSTPLLEHRNWPGAHTPWQTPVTHALFVHATAVPHCPLELHVWTPLLASAHFVLSGAHTP
jgi:hypothetical protein